MADRTGFLRVHYLLDEPEKYEGAVSIRVESEDFTGYAPILTIKPYLEFVKVSVDTGIPPHEMVLRKYEYVSVWYDDDQTSEID